MCVFCVYRNYRGHNYTGMFAMYLRDVEVFREAITIYAITIYDVFDGGGSFVCLCTFVAARFIPTQ